MKKDVIKSIILSTEECVSIYICDLLANDIISVAIIAITIEVILVAANEIAFYIIDERYNYRCKSVIASFDE